MNAALYVGRVGGLAVALGVGAAVATGHGVARAETSSPSSSAPPSSSGSSSMSSSASSGSDSAPDTSGSVEPLVSGPKQSSEGSTTSPVTSAPGSPSGTTSTSSETALAPAGPGMVVSTVGAHTSSTTIRPSADTNSGSRGNHHDLLNGDGDPGGDLRPVRHPKPSRATAPAALPKPSTSTTSQPTDSQQVPESVAAAAATEPPTTRSGGSALASAHDTRASTPVPTLGTPIRTAKVVAVERPVDTLQQRSADSQSDARYAVTPAAVTTMSSTAALRAAPVTTAQAVAPVAAAKPLTPLGIVSGVVSSVLGPLANKTPVAPAQPPALSAVLAWARREFERTFSTSGKTGVVGNPAVAAAAVTPTAAAVVASPTTTEAGPVPPVPAPPATRDHTALLQGYFDSLQPGQTLNLGGHTFRHSGVLRVSVAGVKIEGNGATLQATNDATSAVQINADNVTVNNLTLTAPLTGPRYTTPDQQKVVIQGNGVTLNDVTIKGSASGGVFISAASNFTLNRVRVIRSRADGIHMTNGSNNGKLNNCTTEWTGDDGFAVVSYANDVGVSHDIVIESPTVNGTTWGRGLSVVGGQNITYNNIAVSKTDAAGVYIAAEPSYNTLGVNNVTVTGGTVTDANVSATVQHGAVLVYAGNKSVSAVTISGLTVVDAPPLAGRNLGVVVGTGTVSNIAFRDIAIQQSTSLPIMGGNAPRSSWTATRLTLNGHPATV
jgi:hypothetical protein